MSRQTANLDALPGVRLAVRLMESPIARPHLTSRLADLYAAFFAGQTPENRERCDSIHKHRQVVLARLRRRRVITVADLIARFPNLPDRETYDAIDLTTLLKIPQAIPVLLEMTERPQLRISCAHAIFRLGMKGNSLETFLKIAARELASPQPDHGWLAAVVHGIGANDDPRTEEVLVQIFERCDLPGSLRGDAADKLGVASQVTDRRTGLYRRCRETALAGLSDESIDVQFWSMYLISTLCNRRRFGQRTLDRDFESALPRLTQIAASDHRLAPGIWWPMSAEAEDAIVCIRTGRWPDPEAAERWQRGETSRCALPVGATQDRPR